VRTSSRVTLLFALTAAVGACADQRHPLAPSLMLSGAAACPTSANVVVHDEASLLAALAAAPPGEVIGLDGFFGITADVIISTDGVTLTCATAGSGLFAAPGGGAQDMLTVVARSVTVDRLVLDASQAGEGPYLAFNDGMSFFAESERFTNNAVTCTPGGVCAFVVGGVGAVISDNTFQSAGSFTGIQLQANGPANQVDGAHVERNTLVAIAPSTGPIQGAIRPAGDINLVVADNVVTGPWRSGLSATRVVDSRITGNTFEGAALYGIRTSAAAVGVDPHQVRNTAFSTNRVTASGTAGIFATFACGNVFIGNDLQGNPGNLGLVFDATTGANTYAGNATVVMDNGAFDCDGDGVNDPNIITGAGAARHGVNPGEVVSGAVKTIHGIALQ
jgi:nitrous oxidase accessory protein NosD